jgi:two-component system, cell cycle sensor histidine kinase and response regulator CckA
VSPADTGDPLHKALLALVEESPDGIVLFQREGDGKELDFRRILVNRAAESVLGAAREELLGRSARENARPPLGEDLVEFLTRVEEGTGSSERVVELRSGPEPRIFLFRGRLLSDRVLGIRIVDITDREMARREALRKEKLLLGVAAASERLLSHSWLEVMDEVMMLLGSHAEVSRAYLFRGRPGPERLLLDQLTEWCAPGIESQLDNPLLTGLDLEAVGLGDWRRSFEAGRPVNVTAREAEPAVRSQLEAQDVESLLILPIWLGDQWWGAMGFDQCDRERTWAEGELEVLRSAAALLGAAVQRAEGARELEARDARVAAAVTASRDGFVIITLEGEPVEWNPAAERILGPASGGGVASPETVFPGLLEALVADPTGGDWLEVEGRRGESGPSFPAQVSVSHIRVDARDLLALVVRDLTEEKRMEERFRQMEKLDTVGRLAGGVAHDFNNLLTVIGGNAELARAILEEGGSPVEELREIGQAADKGGRLTQQLLAFSRRQVMLPRSLDLGAIVEDMAQLLDPLIGDHIQVRLELTPELPPVLADPGQMEQVLMNLILNARDAMPQGGNLTLRTLGVRGPGTEGDEGTDRAEWVAMEVEDDGVGMTPEVRKQIFEPFFTTKPEGEGTGLGLATVYGVVKQSQGEIRVASAPGRGTLIQVLLPAFRGRAPGTGDGMDSGGAKEGGASVDAIPAPFHPSTILVADAEASVRRRAREALEARGMRVLEAKTATEAEALLRNADPPVDVLLTEVVLPGISGRRLAEEARRHRSSLRWIFMSGHPRDLVQDQGTIPPGSTFLEKPFAPEEVVQAVERALEM